MEFALSRFVVTVSGFNLCYSLDNSSFDYHWLYGFVNWNLILQSMVHTITGPDALGETKHFMRFVRLLRAVSNPLAIHHFLAFFILMYEPKDNIPTLTVVSHIVPALVVIVDTLMGSHRSPRFAFALYASALGAIFVAWTAIHYHLELTNGKGDRFIVQGMNWADPAAAWRMVGINLFGICPLTAPILWALMYLRERNRPLRPGEERDAATGLPMVLRDSAPARMEESVDDQVMGSNLGAVGGSRGLQLQGPTVFVSASVTVLPAKGSLCSSGSAPAAGPLALTV